MRFAVTGGAGFVGSYLAKQIAKDGHTPVVIDSLYRGRLENLHGTDVEFHKADIRNLADLRKTLQGVDGVFHEAALTDVQESFTKQDEYHDVNVRGTQNVFDVAGELGLKVVYASSSSVYGNPSKIPIKEGSERNPINPYGRTKLEDELIAERYTKDGSSIIGLRYFNVYGRGQTGSYAGVITKFINLLREKKAPIIFGDGSQIRDFVFVEDVARANIAAMNSNTRHGFFNVGTGKTTSIRELAHTMIELSGLNLEPEYQSPLEGDVQSSQADTTLAETAISWRYTVSLKDGLRQFFE